MQEQFKKYLQKEEARQIQICFPGRTDTNKVVVFEGSDELINKLIEVEIMQDCVWYLKGRSLHDQFTENVDLKFRL